jgi:zinc D-Ala-D-Ala dipeptidase
VDEVNNANSILMSDPLVSQVLIQPSVEPFVDLVGFDSQISVDPALAVRTKYYSYVRLSVAQKLVQAKAFLPANIHFLVKEGYRPLHLQQLAFQHSKQRIKDQFPDCNDQEAAQMASKYVAPPEVAPHPTGAAVDLTLIDGNENELDMGTAFDAIPEETENATFFHANNISNEARYNRDILAHALQSVGFINYFTEWWHWSYGDCYWGAVTGALHALYQAVSEQELAELTFRLSD